MPDEDSYRYRPIPLPVPDVIGGQADSATQIAIDPANNVPGPGDPTSSPFGDQVANPISSGSGGGGGGGSCSDDFLAKDINAATINFPCTDPTSTIQKTGASFDDGAGNTATIGVNGVVEIVNGGKTCTIDVTGLPDGAVAQFRQYEICAGQTIWVLSTEPA